MVTIYPSGDTYVDAYPGRGDTNYSTSILLHISKKRYSWDARQRILLQFDISGLSGVTITSALFAAYWEYSADGGYPLAVYRTTSDWDPTTVTFNSQPTYTSGSLMYLGSWSWTSSNIKSQMQAAIDNGDSTFGLIIIFQSESELAHRYGKCRSVETASKPYISFEYTAPKTISGNVKDNDGNNLNNVTITLEDGTDYSTSTNINGDYSQVVNSDIYTVTASLTGYLSSSVSVDASSSDQTQNFTLLKPTISGNVKDNDGNNLNNVTITLENGTDYSTITDIDGNYSQAVDFDIYTATASLTGYLSNSVSVDASLSSQTQNFILLKPVISGNVTNNLGQNLEDVIIELTDGTNYETTTDSNGDYSQTVDADIYDVTASLLDAGRQTESVDALSTDQTQDFILNNNTAPQDKGVRLRERYLL